MNGNTENPGELESFLLLKEVVIAIFAILANLH